METYSKTSVTCDCRGSNRGDREISAVAIIELFLPTPPSDGANLSEYLKKKV